MKLARPLLLAASLLLAPVTLRSTEAAPSVADLIKDRAATAEKAFRTSQALYKAGRGTPEVVYAWSVRWLDAVLEVAPKTAKQAYADHLKRMQDFEAEIQKLFTSGQVSSLDTDSAAFYRIEAELWSARTRR